MSRGRRLFGSFGIRFVFNGGKRYFDVAGILAYLERAYFRVVQRSYHNFETRYAFGYGIFVVRNEIFGYAYHCFFFVEEEDLILYYVAFDDLKRKSVEVLYFDKVLRNETCRIILILAAFVQSADFIGKRRDRFRIVDFVILTNIRLTATTRATRTTTRIIVRILFFVIFILFITP